jgi:Tol biopolymer transport system component
MDRRHVLILVGIVALGACDRRDHETQPDILAPSKVEDLVALHREHGTYDLTWTAPGDDGDRGRVSTYDIRFGPDALTSANWDSAATVSGPTSMKVAGEPETLRVDGLPDGNWVLALRAADEVPNWSEISNQVAVAVEDTTAPAPVQDLRATFATMKAVHLKWTASGDDGRTGTAATYDLRCATESITEETWDVACRVNSVPIPAISGTSETCVVETLVDDTPYYFAIKVIDEVGNESALSNVLSSKTASLSQLTRREGAAIDPDWSPDGQTIAFLADWNSSTDYHYDIFLVPALGGEPTLLVDDPDIAFSPCWSSDGTKIAFTSARSMYTEIYLSEVALGGAVSQVTSFEGALHVGALTWSPDDNTFCFASQEWSGESALYTVSASGGTPARLAVGLHVAGPDWSPDGHRIVFNQYRQGTTEMWKASYPGGSTWRIGGGDESRRSPAYSHDGGLLAFISDKNGSDELYVMSSSGTAEVQLTALDDGPLLYPAWAPSGTQIVFIRGNGGNYNLWTLDLEPMR